MIYIQLIGILAFCIFVLSYYRKTTAEILTYQVTGNAIYFIHYFLLKALSGAFLCIVDMIRDLIFIKKRKHKKIIYFIFITIYMIVTYIFYENILSLLPMFGDFVSLTVIVQNKKKNVIMGGIISSTIWLIYNFFVHSYSGVITEAILIVSNIYVMYRNKKLVIEKHN